MKKPIRWKNKFIYSYIFTMDYILLAIVFLVILLVLFYFISFITSLISLKVPYVPSFNRQLDILKKLELEKWKTIVDLWCWDGKALRFFEKQFALKWVWYDINLFAIMYGRLLNKIYKSNVQLIKENFIGKDIYSYDYIYLYLFPGFLEKIEDWIFENKRKNAIIISTAFTFKKHKPFKVLDKKIYLYV